MSDEIKFPCKVFGEKKTMQAYLLFGFCFSLTIKRIFISSVP